MDGKLFRDLQESYVSVHEEKNWIQSAIKKPGALHKQLGVPEGEKIPSSKLRSAAEKGGKLGQRARLAMTLKGLREEENFESWVDSLLTEGEDLSDFSANELNDLLIEMSKSEKEDKEGHTIALYKDQEKDRKEADYDEEEGKDERSDELRADAGEDRKRMKKMYGKDWKHNKYSTGEKKDSKEPMEKGMKNEENEMFNQILDHLISEGYAESEEAAIAIMANMSEEWRNDIVEAYEPMTKERQMKVDRAKGKAYNKDMMAQHKGDSNEADNQFKRRMAMDSRTKMKK